MADDSRAGVPATVLSQIAHTYRKHVGAPGIQIGRQIEEEARVPVRMETEVRSVEPKIGVLVDTVEAYFNVLVLPKKAKMLPVPAFTAHRVSRCHLPWTILDIKRTDQRRSACGGEWSLLERQRKMDQRWLHLDR